MYRERGKVKGKESTNGRQLLYERGVEMGGGTIGEGLRKEEGKCEDFRREFMVKSYNDSNFVPLFFKRFLSNTKKNHLLRLDQCFSYLGYSPIPVKFKVLFYQLPVP